MIVFTRYSSDFSQDGDDKIIIGDGLVTITVVKIKGRQVRIGVECAREIPVDRFEKHQQYKNKRNADTGNEGVEAERSAVST
jgi:carbon storage regulator